MRVCRRNSSLGDAGGGRNAAWSRRGGSMAFGCPEGSAFRRSIFVCYHCCGASRRLGRSKGIRTVRRVCMTFGTPVFRGLALWFGLFGTLVLFAAACGTDASAPTTATATATPAPTAIPTVEPEPTATAVPALPTVAPTVPPVPTATAVPAQPRATATPLPDTPTQDELIERLRRAESAFFYDIGNYGGASPTPPSASR